MHNNGVEKLTLYPPDLSSRTIALHIFGSNAENIGGFGCRINVSLLEMITRNDTKIVGTNMNSNELQISRVRRLLVPVTAEHHRTCKPAEMIQKNPLVHCYLQWLEAAVSLRGRPSTPECPHLSLTAVPTLSSYHLDIWRS